MNTERTIKYQIKQLISQYPSQRTPTYFHVTQAQRYKSRGNFKTEPFIKRSEIAGAFNKQAHVPLTFYIKEKFFEFQLKEGTEKHLTQKTLPLSLAAIQNGNINELCCNLILRFNNKPYCYIFNKPTVDIPWYCLVKMLSLFKYSFTVSVYHADIQGG